MSRRALVGGGHFNSEASQCFEEDTRFDGRNHISVATGSQWEHEQLFLTRKGTWVLHNWSQWQGTVPTFERIDSDAAINWIVKNGCDYSRLDETTIAEIESAIAAREV